MGAKKTVFLTGATGSMGSATLSELMERRDRFDIVILVREGKDSQKALRHYRGEPGLTMVWGDLRDYDAVLECVTGADYVLHTAALISPAADDNPELTRDINVGSVENILRAIKDQPDPDAIRLVTVGSVAMTGSRLPPIHWGRVGDPLAPSIGDHYALTKIDAEKMVIESGLKHWVSLRQTFITIPQPFGLTHPILFHQPLDTQIEFVTSGDSGRLMANACEADVPEDFWRRVYNIGGGQGCRTNYVEYFDTMFGALGLGTLSEVTERNWFALKNFHCQWYLDSDVLESYLHFRSQDLGSYIAQVVKESPWFMKPALLRFTPTWMIRRFVFQAMAKRPEGPLGWFATGNRAQIEAFFGSRQEWEQISDWSEPIPPVEEAQPLSHGFDDTVPDAELGIEHAQSAATFRGGKLVSKKVTTGDVYTPVSWSCARGHTFDASPYLVMRAGHWCPECQAPPWNYDERAREDSFFAQVWPNSARVV
jgi:nucleoside-diphosphate-sugar epimerase